MLKAIVEEVVAAEIDTISNLGGNAFKRNKLTSYLMGQLMKKTKGTVDPAEVFSSLLSPLSSLRRNERPPITSNNSVVSSCIFRPTNRCTPTVVGHELPPDTMTVPVTGPGCPNPGA